MDAQTQIKTNIENTRENITDTINVLSNKFHEKIDLENRIRENPYGAVLAAAATGFLIAGFSRTIIKVAMKTVPTVLGAYVSQKVIEYIIDKVK